jgi:hypothetical protein
MSKEMREQIDRVKNWKQFLNENENLMNQILDKISSNGIVSLNTGELKYLKQYSSGQINPDLEKALQVESGFVFVSKNRNIPLLRFEYNFTEESDEEYQEMLHKGTVYFDELEFDGDIYCDKNGKYQAYDFHTYQNNDDDTTDQVEDLAYYDDDYNGLIEKFFKNEVCPYLTYSF